MWDDLIEAIVDAVIDAIPWTRRRGRHRRKRS